MATSNEDNGGISLMEELYHVRWLILMENETYDGFHVVKLTKSQFMEFSNLMQKFFCKSVKEGSTEKYCVLPMDERRTLPAVLFEGCNDFVDDNDKDVVEAKESLKNGPREEE